MRIYLFPIFIFGLLACETMRQNQDADKRSVPPASVWNSDFDQMMATGARDSSVSMFMDSFLRTGFQNDSLSQVLAGKLFDLGSSYLFANTQLSRNAFICAIRLQSAQGKDPFNLQSVRALTNIGFNYLIEGEHFQAIRYFDSVLVFKNQFPVFPTLFALTRKGESLTQLGELKSALHSFHKAEEIFIHASKNINNLDAEAWSKARKRIFDLYVQWASTLILDKHFHEAENVCTRGIEFYRTYADAPDTSNGLAGIFLIKGNVLLAKAEESQDSNIKMQLLNTARIAYQTANQYYEEIEKPEYQLFALNNIGTTYYKQLKYHEALATYQFAIKLNAHGGNLLDPTQYSSSLLNSGSCFFKIGKIDSALSYYQQLLNSFTKGENSELPQIKQLAKDYDLSCFLLGSLGRAYLVKSNEDISFQHKSQVAYDSLSLLLNYMRGNLMNDQAKIRLAEKARHWIPDAVLDMSKLYLSTGKIEFKEKVFHFIEHSKAFSLLEASRLNNATEKLPKPLQRIQNDISNMPLDGDADAQLKFASKQIAFFERLQHEAPSYFTLKYGGIKIDPKHLQNKLLEPDQSMLEYFIHDSLLLILVFQRDTVLLDTVNMTKRELYRLVSEFRDNMNPVDSTGLISESKQSLFCKQANRLHDILVGRMKSRIRLNSRLIIIPDGPLNDLSFDALLSHWVPGNNHVPDLVKNEAFLVQQYAVSYCFSASLLEEMKKSNSRETLEPKLALFAPKFHKNSVLLPYMYYQQEEIGQIKSAISSSTSFKENSKEKFIETTRKNSFIHIATHGFESQDPDLSFLAFDQKTHEPDTTQFLFLKELYHLPMRQELLTLTACETALGKLREGEGNISLARGFAYAGVKAMITSLWKIQTQGASKILPQFYHKFLNEGKPKDVALNESKRAYLKKGKAVYPDDWAGLILIGNTQAKREGGSGSNLIWWMSAFVVFIGIYWLWRYRKT